MARKVGAGQRLVVVPTVAVACVLVFAATVWAGGSLSPSTPLLVRCGALVPAVLRSGQYWRLVAAGFLHVSLLHLGSNMLSLLVCGPVLERRLGPTRFAAVYAAALVGGGLASLLAHPGFFVGVGASGAIFGLLGALFALWAQGRIAVPGSFFLGNIALNVVAAVQDPQIDWVAHLGGAVTGMVCVVLLQLCAKCAELTLRCRFPEFVTANAFLLAVLAAGDRWAHPVGLLGLSPAVTGAGALAFGGWAFVKLLDVLLATRRGLAGVVVVLGLCNGVATAALAALRLPPGWHGGAVAAGLVVFASSLVLYARPLRRGLDDLGFVPAGLVAGRRRGPW